jgi:hypothetical protein
MYEERRESFSIRDLILQVLFVILFVFILIWIFPTKDYMKKYIGENKSNTTVETGYDLEQLAVLYNQIFANNIATMKEAAVGYYTIERMPAKVGDTDKMTLQQMYDRHLVLTLRDKNGEACDSTRSYVSVTKYEDEYQMKINLSCGGEEDYIIAYLGCYDYCEASGVCERQVTTTKPSKPTTSKPSKPSNVTNITNNITNNINNNYYENCDCEKPEPPVESEYLCEYKKVTGGSWGAYGPWSEWTTAKITESNNTQVETKVEKVVTGYTTKKVQTGTKTETYVSGYTTSKYISGYTTEKYVSGNTTEKYISGYTTQKVASGTKQVQVGTTTKTEYVKVPAGTTQAYHSSGSGTTIPSNTSEYIYVKTGSTTSQSCSSCATVTIYTWNVYKITTVYKTEARTTQVPVYATETIYTTKQVPVYSTRQVPVYATRKVPVYATKKVPVYATRSVPVYDEIKVAVYGTQTYYRSRTRAYTGGSESVKWSTCDPVDTSLINSGYYLTGNVKKVK